MKIIIIHKNGFHKRPPVISVLLILLDLGFEVTLITTGITQEWLTKLTARNCKVYVFNENPKLNQYTITKIFNYISYKKFVYSILKHEYSNNCILWIEGAYTITALGNKIKKYNYILQIQELHEKSKLQQRAISSVIHDAKLVFMPEFNRTILYQVWFKLKQRPIVLPNKPYFIPSTKELDILSSKYPDLVNIFNSSKIILYQGLIHPERDLTPFVYAVKKLNGFKLVLLGKDFGEVNRYKQIDSNIIHIDYLPAPDYLLFTSLCHIGIVTYNPLELNTTYCAPNKIYEYGAFGKPMIGNNIPGLSPILAYQAGRLIDEISSDRIINSVLEIDKSYSTYSNNAYMLYNNTNNKQTIKINIEKVINNE